MSKQKRPPKGTTTRFKPWMCFSCGHVCDAASSLTTDDAVPEEGDVSACINCAEPSILRDGKWAQARAEDLEALSPETRRELVKHQTAIHAMHAAIGKPGDRRVVRWEGRRRYGPGYDPS